MESHSWEPASNCGHCEDLISYFYQSHPNSPGAPGAPRDSSPTGILAAMKLPKNHKNFAVGDIRSGGVSPLKPMGGNVTVPKLLPGITRPKKGICRYTKKLEMYGDLSYVMDRRWVTAKPILIGSYFTQYEVGEDGSLFSGKRAQISQVAEIAGRIVLN